MNSFDLLTCIFPVNLFDLVKSSVSEAKAAFKNGIFGIFHWGRTKLLKEFCIMIINEVKFNMEHCTNGINNAPLKKVFTENATPRSTLIFCREILQQSKNPMSALSSEKRKHMTESSV